jgi:hypothetical protein
LQLLKFASDLVWAIEDGRLAMLETRRGYRTSGSFPVFEE